MILIPIGTVATRWAEKKVASATAFMEEKTEAATTAPASAPSTAGSDKPTVRSRVKSQKFVPLLILWQITRYALGIGLLLLTVQIVYNFGISIKQRIRWVTPGAVFSIVVWLTLGALFRIYVDKFGKYNETYGTVGGVAILLLFFYLDAVVLLVGAEINSEIDFISLGVEPGSRDFRRVPWQHLKPPTPVPQSPPEPSGDLE
jgi:hypothetical protein